VTEPTERWRRIEEICHAALARSAGQRPAFLREACGDDDGLRHGVETLLAQESAAERFLASPVGAVAAQVVPSATPRLAGQRFGVFQVGELLGSGGMGDVYRALDTRLGRDVALKVLPPEFTADAERLVRIEREAHLLGALNHPNIAAIYALEQVGGVSGLILELVEGPTLADRLARGRCSPNETVRIARQIAEALDAAHEKGIAHRDLKPGNVKVTHDGIVKVLDFGLAKVVESSVGAVDRDHSGTLPVASTGDGIVLGTVAYMAPEQARGQVVDRRADIWAFGVVVYEMLTGTLPFHGESTSDVMAAVLNKEPDWSALPDGVPARVRELLRLCLTKDRRQRLQAIGDARIFLDAPVQSVLSRPDVPRRSALGWSVAGLLALALAIGWWSESRAPRSEVDQPFLQLDLDAGSNEVSQLAISPDGMRIVFVSNGHLATRRLDEGTVTSLSGTDGASNPFFSPDGRWVAFFAEGTLKKMSLAGGAPVTLCDARGFYGGTWDDNDTIIAAVDQTGALFRVPAVGGTPHPFTDASAGGASSPTRNWPQVLPRGQGVLFGASNGSGQGSLQILTPDGGVKTLVKDTTHGRYLTSGFVVYHQEGTLFAAPVDLGRFEVTGPAVRLVEGVSHANGRANFDVSASGTLVYHRTPGGTDLVASWIGSSGVIEQLPLKPGNYRMPRLSPEGTRLALSVIEGSRQNLWVYNLRRNTFTRLTFGVEPDSYPTWTPDGEFLAFRSGNRLVWTRSDGSGSLQRLEGVSANASPWSFSHDGRWLAFWPIQPDGEIWIVPVERTPAALRLGAPRPLMPQTGAKGAPAISPDGRWLAYTSGESGRAEVYVMPFVSQGTPGAGKWPVSNDGGFAPTWSGNGRDLFFQSLDGYVQVAAYARLEDSFEVEKPRLWSDTRLANFGLSSGYDVAPDGTHVIALLASSKPEMFLHVLLNVSSELRRRAPEAGK